MRKELLITKRILAGVAAGLVLFIYAAIPSMAMLGGTLPPSMTRVREPSANGVWVYSKTELYEKDDYEYHGEQGGHFNNEYYSSSANEHEEINEVLSSVEENNLAVNIRCHQRNSFSTPPQVLTPQDEVDLKMTNELLDYFCIYPDDWVTKDLGNYENKESCFYYGLEVMFPADEEGYRDRWTPSSGHIEVKQYPGWKIRYRDTSVMNQTNMGHGNVKFSLISPLTSSGEYVLTVPLGSPGDTFILSAHSFHGNMATSWYYEWQEDGTSAVTSTESGDEDVNPQKTYTQEDYTEASTKPGEDKGTDIVSEIFEKSDDSSDIPGTIMIGGAGVLVSAGALGASGGKKKKKKQDKKKESKEKSTFKMYINKAFGDVLAKGGEPQYVYARIMEVMPGGQEKERNDLTKKISVFSKDNSLDVSDAGMTTNGYKAALVTVPKDGDQAKGVVSFMFAGEGGVYTRNVIFNLVGGNPVIIFPKLADDGVNWLDSSQPGEAVFIAGKGGTEKVMFYIKDAVEEPIDIRFDGGPDFNVSYEKEAAYRCGYYAVVENCSPEIEKANGIIADAVTKTISVEAEFKDGTITNSEFYVQLYPDGLSVVPNTKYFKDDIFQVITVAEDNPKPGEIPIMPSSFDVLVCYVDSGTGEAKIFKNPSLSCQEPDDEGRYGNTFKENFEYRIDYTTAGGYDFYPKCTLPMFGKPYDAKMKLIYKGKNGTRFDGDLPIQFWGEIPQPPSEATRREEELKHLRRIIREFGIDNNPNLKIMLSNIEYYSASDIRFVRSYVLLLGVQFYREESRVNIDFGNLCDKYVVVSSALVKAGDYAIQVILEVKFGANGKIAAAFINPFKNMLCEYVGQYIGLGAEPGTNVEVDSFWKVLTGAVRDALGEYMTGKKKPEPEAMGYVVAAYMLYAFSNHYFHGKKEVKGDVYRSVLAATGDLSLTLFKSWLSDEVEKWLKGIKLQEFGEWCAKKLDGFFSGITQQAMKAAGDKAFEKGIRSQIEGGIGWAEYALAKSSKELAQDNAKNIMEMFVYYADNTAPDAIEKLANISLAAVCNYFLYGVLDDPEDANALGGTLEDVTVELVTKLLGKIGLKPENVYKFYGLATGFSSFKIDYPTMTVVWLGYAIEVDYVKNLTAIWDLFYHFTFGWLNAIFENPGPDPSTLPDYRDRLDENLGILEDTLHKVEDSVKVRKV